MRIRETIEGRQAEQIQSRYNAEVNRIRSDDRFTPEGKAQHIEAEYEYASKALDAIKEAVNAKKTQRIASLRRDLFGTTGGDAQAAISFRDAQERVGALERMGGQDKALKLLDQAELSGDSVMVKAVVQRSLENGWNKVVNLYSQNHPAGRVKLEELQSLQAPGGILASPDGADNAFLFHISKPKEVF